MSEQSVHKKKHASAAKSAQRPHRRKKKKKGISVFYIIYLLLIAAAAVSVTCGMRYLRAYLAAYEDSQPKYVAQEVAKTFLNRDFATLYRYEDQSQFANETQQQYVDYMNSLTDGMQITYSQGFSDSPDTMRYLVKADGISVGEFTLRQDGQPDEYGFEAWTLDSMMTTGVLQSQTYRVSAPAASKVYVNGDELPREFVVAEKPLLEVSSEMPHGLTAPLVSEYEFSRYFGVDEVKVVDAYGQENLVDVSGNTYVARFNYDDERMREAVEERVIKVVRRLSCFMTDDYSRSSLCTDLIEKSKAYVYVRAFDTNWIASHKSYEFSNMEVSNYISYGDDCFSVEARYDYTIIYRKADPETYPTAYRLFFQKKGEQWYLFDFTLI